MNQDVKTKIKILINSVLFCLLAFLVMIVFIPKLLGYDTYYIQSNSMSPSIKKGSLAFAKEIEFKNISPGDVLTLECELVEQHGPVGIGKATAWVDGVRAANAELTFVITDA